MRSSFAATIIKIGTNLIKFLHSVTFCSKELQSLHILHILSETKVFLLQYFDGNNKENYQTPQIAMCPFMCIGSL